MEHVSRCIFEYFIVLAEAFDKGQGSQDQTFSILKAGTVLLDRPINTVLWHGLYFSFFFVLFKYKYLNSQCISVT